MTAPAIDTVLFDLDDTLIEYERGASEVLEIAFERADVDPLFDAAEYYVRYDEFLHDSASVADLRENCFAALAAEAGHDPALGRRVAAEFTAERDQSRVRFLPGAREALDALAAEYALGIVTNGAPEMQREKMDALGIRERVGTVVYAGYDTPAKPDPEPFRRVLDLLDSTPETAVHVGNSLTTDVPGARAAGVRSAWVPADPDLVPDPAPDYAFESVAALASSPWDAE